MPCVYDDYGASERKMREDLDEVTRMLCSVCKRIFDDYEWDTPYFTSVDGLEKWYLDHMIRDQRRLDREKPIRERMKKKQEALAKLTDEEKELLGLSTAPKEIE